MKIVKEYYERLKQVVSVEDKKAIAVELHQLARKFGPTEREEYRRAMHEKHLQLLATLPDIDAAVEKSQHLIKAIEAWQTVEVHTK